MRIAAPNGIARRLGAMAVVATATMAPTMAMADDAAMSTAQSTCWVCNFVNQFLALIQHFIIDGTPIVARSMWPLMVVMCAIALVYGIVKGMAGGTPFFEHIAGHLLRIAAAALIIAGPIDAGRVVADYFVGVPMTIAPTIGEALADNAAQAYNLVYNPSNCTYASAAASGVSDPTFTSISTAMMPIICRIHYAIATSIRIGGVITTHQRDDSSSGSTAQSAIIAACGLMVMYVSFMALLAFGLSLCEGLLTLGMFGVFMPFYAFFWIFPSTRVLMRNAIGTLAYTFFLLVLTGGCASLVTLISLIGMTLGLGGSVAAMMTPDQIATNAQTVLLTQGTAASIGATIKFAAFTGISAFISTRLLRGVNDLATQVSQIGQTAVPTRVFAGSVAGTITTVSSMSFGALAYGGAIATRIGAGGAGRALGRIAGRTSRSR